MKANLSTMNEIERNARKAMKDATNNGITAGAKAVCTIVLEMAEKLDKTAEEKLQDIISFCKTNLA